MRYVFILYMLLFIVFLYLYFSFTATDLALSDTIELEKCEIINTAEYTTTANYQSVTNNAETLSHLEELVHVWCKQIEQVGIIIFQLALSVKLNMLSVKHFAL